MKIPTTILVSCDVLEIVENFISFQVKENEIFSSSDILWFLRTYYPNLETTPDEFQPFMKKGISLFKFPHPWVRKVKQSKSGTWCWIFSPKNYNWSSYPIVRTQSLPDVARLTENQLKVLQIRIDQQLEKGNS